VTECAGAVGEKEVKIPANGTGRMVWPRENLMPPFELGHADGTASRRRRAQKPRQPLSAVWTRLEIAA